MKKTCPWCNKSLALSRPGTRHADKKWNGISLYPKYTLVCPHCNKSIAPDTKSKQWLILMLPLLGTILWRAWTLEHWTNWADNLGLFEFAIIILAIIGMYMEGITSHYVKCE